MKLKRISFILSLCLILMLSLTACTSSKSFTFQIENGEKIKVTLNTTDGYNLLQKDGTITIQKDDTNILAGFFLTSEGYEQYADMVNSSSNVTIIKMTPEDAPTFYLYQLEGEAGTETTFLFKVENAETGVILASLASADEAETAFNLLTFEKSK